MNKRTVILPVLLVVALSIAAFFCYMQKKQETLSKQSVVVNEVNSFKKVDVSDGKISFTFEIPEDWITETRNSGEKPMSEQELRDYLSTSYREENTQNHSDIQLSDYANLSWEWLQKATFAELKMYMRDRAAKNIAYPSASVSGNHRIGYADWNAQQIDFYILNSSEAQERISSEKKSEAVELMQYDKKVAEMLKTEWVDASVDGRVATVANYQLEVLENGERLTEGFKGRPAGKKYYISIPEMNKTLLIDKQSFTGNIDFEQGFDHLIKTFKFQD